MDHFAYDSVSSAEQHDVLVLPRPKPLRDDVKNFFGGDGLLAFPHGVAQSLGAQSALLAPILKAPRTAYTYNPKDSETDTAEDVFASGQQLSLVSTMQTRNSARFTILGAAEMLEDVWFGASVKTLSAKNQEKTANQDFVKRVAQWTFKELGVLKVGGVEHWLEEKENYAGNETGAVSSEVKRKEMNPGIYRIKNDVVSETLLLLISKAG